MATRYSLEGRLGNIYAMGAKLKGDVAEATLSASLSLSTSAITQLDLAIADDADFTLLRSGVFNAGTITKRGSHMSYLDLDLEVRAIEVSARGADHALKITARSIGAGNLKRAKGPLVRKGLTPTQFAALEAKAAGLKFVGQPSAKRKTIHRKAGKNAETSWDTIQRLAEELGYIAFESAGVLYFGKPTWLAERKGVLELHVPWRGRKTDDAIDAVPNCRRSGDDAKNAATVTAALRGDLGELARTGMALILDGVPGFDGRYLVDGVTLNLAEGAPVSVSASTPINPKPVPPVKTSKAGTSVSSGSSSSTSTGATGAKSAAQFVAIALAQLGDSYVYGAETSASDPNPNAFDCSELVQWALARTGITFTDGSSAQIAACTPISVEQAIKTRGALLHHPGHIAISLGDGKTIEAANSRVGVVSYNAAGRFTDAGLVPGLRY